MKVISKEEGLKVYSEIIEGKNPNWAAVVRDVGGDRGYAEQDLAAVVRTISEHLEERDVDALASVEFHSRVRISDEALVTAGHWIFLSLTAFREIILRRFPGKGGKPTAAGNFGLGGTWDCYPRYLWMRGKLGYDENDTDPYRRARLGQVDDWKSHILRIEYGSNFQLRNAFIDLVMDPKCKVKTATRRMVAKDITRTNATRPLEAFSYSEARDLIKDILARRG